jgi:hypothetical protein
MKKKIKNRKELFIEILEDSYANVFEALAAIVLNPQFKNEAQKLKKANLLIKDVIGIMRKR